MTDGPDPHALGWGQAIVVPWRQVVRSPDIDSALRSIERYGWLPVVLGLCLYGIVKGGFIFASDPFNLIGGYRFDGWPLAFAITLVEGVFTGLLAWFFYFGAIGALAGFLSSERIMATELFKVGGYLVVTFVPVFLVGSVLVTTVTIPDAVATDVTVLIEEPMVQARAHEAVYDTVQMTVVQVLEGVVWVLVGFLLLPVVSELYDIDERSSVLAVLPVTLAALAVVMLPT